jgi:hypothetical protein
MELFQVINLKGGFEILYLVMVTFYDDDENDDDDG